MLVKEPDASRASNWVQRLVAIVVSGAAVLVCTAARSAPAAEIAVTSTAGTRGGPACTLRDAITAANLDTAAGGCPAGSGADTIVLMPGATYLLDGVDNMTMEDGVAQPNGLPSITSDITIVGDGTTIARSNADLAPALRARHTAAFRLLHVAAGGRLTVTGLTLTGGRIPAVLDAAGGSLSGGEGGAILNAGTVTLTQTAVTANGADDNGGGIYNKAGATLALLDSTVSDNQADLCDSAFVPNCPGVTGDGAGIVNDGIVTLDHCVLSGNTSSIGNSSFIGGHDGAAIFNTGTVTLTDCVLNQNACDGYSGAIDNGGTATLTRCVLTENSEAVGGAITNHSGVLTVTDSTFARNSGEDGGAIDNDGTATLNNCTLQDNFACSNGGAIRNGGMITLTNCTLSGNYAISGGGGSINFGTSSFTNCTLSGNEGAHGGGVDNRGALVMTNCTVSDNHGCCGRAIENDNGGTATVNDTIIGHNVGADSDKNCSGPILGNGHNLGVDDSCNSDPDLIVSDPLLAPLGNYGGPTSTMALCTGAGIPVPSCIGPSPAIDAGEDAVTRPPLDLATDQRGLPRKSALHVDIGAYEVQPQDRLPICIGDCNRDGQVAVDELITLVSIALGNAELSACPNGVVAVDIALIVQAVNNALNGCGVG